ncbi:hypothetical protein [Alcanivorax sp. DP30]|uniref:hypothetical protein n=1 Tax=Alcanivorax sp. DP30 TaxID=2606217 RepID=UPI00136C3404|nr:hypothetical protein [Alcanivorax sp. DP30]MZR62441.1 hypothetical protein [Alcanivorax sp. DP30]
MKNKQCWSVGLTCLLALLVATCGMIVLLPGLGGGFMLDDMQSIVQNSALHLVEIKSLDDLLYAAYSFDPGGGTRPLVMLSFALDILRSGLDPVAFKITNIVIHALTGFALVFFFRKLLCLAAWSPREIRIAAPVLALIWAIHPLQVSSVLYIVQRMQIMSTLFVVLSLLSYLCFRDQNIKGEKGRVYGFLVILFGLIAFACKEDAVLLPVYCLVIELTVLRFDAKAEKLKKLLRYVYGTFFVVGLIAYLFVVVPYYWHSDWYPGRVFTSAERLMTQARVLWMYLAQLLLPLPSMLPFNYDDFAISRNLWQPKTTMPAIVGLAGLLYLAWRWRKAFPVFSLGVLLFFAGHFLTSNVIGLEMVFEHRNHFPLIGFVLAIIALIVALMRSRQCPRWLAISVISSICIAEAGAAVYRAYIWGDELRRAEYNLRVASDSERAWINLCTSHFRLRQKGSNDPHLNMAIDVCQRGADRISDSVVLMNNVVIYKTIKGSVTEQDWEALLGRLERAPMTVQNKRVLWVTLNNVDYGLFDNEKKVLRVIDIITGKTKLRTHEYLRVAAYIFNDTHEPIKALPFLEAAVRQSSLDDPDIQKMLAQLKAVGRQDWVDHILEAKEADEKNND